MKALDLNQMNRNAPYHLDKAARPNYYHFISKVGAEFVIGFDEDDFISSESYQFIIVKANDVPSPMDKGVRDTVFVVIQEFFRANPFLNDVDARALKCSLQDQEKAVKGCAEDPNAVKLKYKSRKNHWQFYRTWGVSIIKEQSKGFVDLPVVGRVKVRGLCGGYKRIISATVERAPSGNISLHWWSNSRLQFLPRETIR